MPSDASLSFLSASELRERIGRRELEPIEVVDIFLDRIERLDPVLHSFVEVYADEARKAAQALTTLERAGYPMGPLFGVPIAVKDLCDIAGRPTGFGSRRWNSAPAAATSTVVNKLKAAGAVIVGRTHMVEFAFGGWGTNAVMGTPRNPWDRATHRSPGGSSSGSGVAVGAGLVPAALGSDTGGSVRIPASFCGIVGLKVTAGRISNHGVASLSSTLDTIGPMARSVTDAALLFEVLAGADSGDPATRGAPAGAVMATLQSGIAGMRLGIMPESERAGVEPEVLAAYDASLVTLEALGAHLVSIRLPQSFSEYQARTVTIIGAEGYPVHRAHIDDTERPIDPNVRGRVLGGRDVSAADYRDALGLQRADTAAYLEAVAGCDALLMPTSPHPAQPVDTLDEGSPSVSRFTRAGNYLGLCALALPNGFTTQGLPLSLQIIGKPNDEATVLRAGWAFENATEWGKRMPPI